MNSLVADRLGSQQPRASSHPEYLTSDGPDCVEFACAMMREPLDEWQDGIIVPGLGLTSTGDWAAKRVGVWVPRQSGKGRIIEALELYWLFVTKERLVVHSAHEHRTATSAYQRLESIIRSVPELHAQVAQYRQTNGEHAIILRDGRRLIYTSRSKSALRGLTISKLIVDEAQELTLDQYKAIRPALSAVFGWQVWLFGTPPNDPTAWCYQLKENGERGADRLAWFDWGADLNLLDPEDRRKVSDRNTWYECNPALGIRIDEETVEGELVDLGIDGFAQERLGVWLPRRRSSEDAPISAEVWAGAAVWPERPDDRVFAIQVNNKRSHTALLAVGPRVDGRLQMSVIDYRPGTHWVVARVVELNEKWKPMAWVAKDRGATASLFLDLQRAGFRPVPRGQTPKRGDLVVPQSADASKAYGMFVDGVGQGTVVHQDDPELNVAVDRAKTRAYNGGTEWDHRVPEVAPLEAATFGVWAYQTHQVRLQENTYDVLASFGQFSRRRA